MTSPPASHRSRPRRLAPRWWGPLLLLGLIVPREASAAGAARGSPPPQALRAEAAARLAAANTFRYDDRIDETYLGHARSRYRALGDVRGKPFMMRFHLTGEAQPLTGAGATRHVNEEVIEVGPHVWVKIPSATGRWKASRHMTSVVAPPANDPLNFAFGGSQVALQHLVTLGPATFQGIRGWRVQGIFPVSTGVGSGRTINETVDYFISARHPTLYSVSLDLRDPTSGTKLHAQVTLSRFGEHLSIHAPKTAS